MNQSQAASALGGLNNGFNGGLTNGLVPRLDEQLDLTGSEEAILGASLFVGGIVGAISGIVLNDTYGRRKTTILGEIVIVAFTICQLSFLNLNFIVASRTITGFGFGICAVTKPLYVSELSEASVRGFAVALFSVMFSVGNNLILLCETVLPSSTSDSSSIWSEDAWRVELALSALPAVGLLLVVTTSLPESPVFLFSSRGKMKSDDDEESTGLLADKINKNNSASSEDVSTALNRALIVVLLLSFLHQFTMIAAYMGYTSDLLDTIFHVRILVCTFTMFKQQQQITIQIPESKSVNYAIAISISHLVGVIISLFTIDGLGRRPLLFVGLTVMMMSVISTLVLEFNVDWDDETSSLGWTLELILLCTYTIGFQMGPAPCYYVLVNELFPLQHRSLGNGVGITLIFLWCCLVMALYPVMNITAVQILVWELVVLVSCTAYLWSGIPETKGVRIDQVTKMWSRFLRKED